jgi:hypothetical protein
VADRERSAYEMLRWVPYSLHAPFDPALAIEGHYSRLQDHRSHQALDAWDAAHPYEQSPELQAFHTLQAIGQLKEHDYFSPERAKQGGYAAELKRITTANDISVSGGAERAQRTSPSDRRQRSRSRLASGYAEPGRPPGR